MATKFIVPLQKLIRDFNLEVVYLPEDAAGISISTPEVNRPGLQLSGFFDYFDHQRMQILGKSEFAFLDQFDEEERTRRVDDYFASQPSAVVITRNIEVTDRMRSAAQKYKVPLLRTADGTSAFMAGLIADDAVEIRRVSAKSLVGSSPENIRHFMELRGVGIINARRLFGIGAVKMTEKINMIVQLEQWDAAKVYDRMGMNDEYTEVLGVQIPSLTIPVKPGRNLAIIIEVAAMNNRQKRMGYNAAQELLEKLGMVEPDGGNPTDWGDF